MKIELMKQIDDALALIHNKMKDGLISQALKEIAAIYSPFFALDFQTIQTLDPTTLRSLFGNIEKIRALAQVLDVHASLHESAGDPTQANECRKMAKRLEDFEKNAGK